LVVEDALDSNYVCGVSTVGTDSGHHGDQDMFLDSERARVDRGAENADVGYYFMPGTADGENE